MLECILKKDPNVNIFKLLNNRDIFPKDFIEFFRGNLENKNCLLLIKELSRKITFWGTYGEYSWVRDVFLLLCLENKDVQEVVVNGNYGKDSLGRVYCDRREIQELNDGDLKEELKDAYNWVHRQTRSMGEAMGYE